MPKQKTAKELPIKHSTTDKMNGQSTYRQEGRTANSRFAKAGFSCFYESEELNPSFVHLMKFCAENPRLRKAANR